MKQFFTLAFAAFALTSMAQTASVTFNLNMSLEEVAESGVFMAGGADFGVPGDNPMTDPDGDGVYSITIEVTTPYTGNYTFTNGACTDWSCKENIAGQDCADGTWNDRLLSDITEDTVINTCFAQCSTDGECFVAENSYEVTFNLNMSQEEVSEGGVYLAGGASFGVAGDNEMLDEDGDGIYSITMMLDEGLASHYTFLNGNCGDWSCKEDLAGLECGDADAYNDRFLPTVTGPTTISTCFGECSTDGTCGEQAATSAVTFHVDMGEYEGDYTMVNLNGNFNGWCGDCNEMTDEDGDGIYRADLDLDQGVTYEYKFTLDGWTAQEEFVGGEDCTSTIDGYTNRTFTVGTMNEALPIVCFNSCAACESTGGGGDSTYMVTFNVNMANEDVSEQGVFIAGGADFGVPGDNPMLDDDGDGIYTISTIVPAGFSGYYTFTNGACADWSCKENLAGLPCGDPTNYNDRFLEPVNQITTVSTCFGQCTTDGSCESASDVEVTFRVDMSEQTVAGGVFLHAGFDGWGSIEMTDDDGDNIYETTQTLATGNYEFLYQNGEGVNEAFDAENFTECTITSGAFTNRLLTVGSEATQATDAYCYNACTACEGANGLEEIAGFDFQLIPSVTTGNVEMRFAGVQTAKQVSIVSFTGALIHALQVPANENVFTLDLSGEAAGVYFIQVQAEGLGLTQKLLKVN
jgi:hypothetical protein